MAESQIEPKVEQPQSAEPQPKLSPEEFSAKLASGEIDTSSADPQELIDKMVNFGEEQETPSETPLGEEASVEKPDKEKPKAEPEPASEPTPYKNFGELMADAAETLGEKLPSARDLVAKAKNQKEQLQNMQAALERWKTDATTNSAQIDELKSQIAELKAKTEKVATPAPTPALKSDKEPDFESEIPEVDRPGEFADAEEVAKYFEKVRKRDQIVSDKKMKWLKAQNEKAQRDYEAKIEKANQSAQEKVELEVKMRREQEAANAQRQQTIAAATEFVTKHRELGITDVEDANSKYVNWLNQVEYVKRNNANYSQRNLVADYFNGVPDATQLLDSMAVTPPEGAKELALVIELQNIANQHNMRDSLGRLNFEEAYILKKARDGVDIEETNDRVAKAVEKTVDLVQQRQSAPQDLRASEVAAPDTPAAATPEQLSERMAQLQRNMSSMRPEERAKAQKEIEELMSVSLGVDPLKTGV